MKRVFSKSNCIKHTYFWMKYNQFMFIQICFCQFVFASFKTCRVVNSFMNDEFVGTSTANNCAIPHICNTWSKIFCQLRYLYKTLVANIWRLCFSPRENIKIVVAVTTIPFAYIVPLTIGTVWINEEPEKQNRFLPGLAPLQFHTLSRAFKKSL